MLAGRPARRRRPPSASSTGSTSSRQGCARTEPSRATCPVISVTREIVRWHYCCCCAWRTPIPIKRCPYCWL
eukprot:3225837-Lingulodinium_polyedra.AAC.1